MFATFYNYPMGFLV